ncbi:hypothetical protein J8C06_07440 [Chloracidobacterium validum]|uniref:Uncharacterized protein n=1 Tax=Chloracidobacterium validum TaxID=2821543 RepID=A0ABX8B5F7_9BACT|nr:hypothetical protein [Chloracidobacterium validum]QUW02197.1 hypothetical protein J8C06_07440 [Chloracidobacterium validum]
MNSLYALVTGWFPRALAANWWGVISVTVVIVFVLLAIALLWFALRQLQTSTDNRDVGDDGLLGLVEPGEPAAPPSVTPAAGADGARPPVAVVNAPAAEQQTAPLPEPSLPVEIRPQITADDLAAVSTERAAESVSSASRQVAEDNASKSTVASPLPTAAAEATPSVSSLAKDIQARLAHPVAAPLPKTTSPLDGTTSPLTPPPAETTVPVTATSRALNTPKRETGKLETNPSASPKPSAALTERLPAQRKTLRPPPSETTPLTQPVPAVRTAVIAPPGTARLPEEVVRGESAAAATSDLADAAPPLPVQFVPKVAAPSPSPNATPIAPPNFLGDDRPTGIGREALWLGVGFVVFMLLLGSVVVVFFPAIRSRVLPPTWAERVAALPRGLGIETPPPPPVPVKQVEVRQYANAYSSAPKGATGKIVRTVTIAGVVKNITDETLYDLRAEIELYPRTPDGAPPERRIIYLTPNLLEPQQEGRYTLTIVDADYRQSSLKRIVTGDGREMRELPAVFVPGTLEPPEEPVAKPSAATPSSPARRR